ncbi:hypothetical protein [Streptomyces sp. NPDC001933]|uniref:hypothetical protein n=1 Tax=Streptomyces sp. NPDC001933 TaxID=3364626 RepID=UPI0036BC5473
MTPAGPSTDSSWLHLTVAELAAGAVLLGVMTGENPDVIVKTPAAHHRADGYSGAAGMAIVDLRKLRRGRRAYMNLALTDVPDWISVPESPEVTSTRDELHTPFGLYLLLHELTARSRAMAGGNRLLVGYAASGGQATGRGIRPLSGNALPVARLGHAHGLTRDEPDEKGNPVPLPLRLDLLRLTFIELHQKPVAHTEKTAATYMLCNRGNITEYQKVVAETLTSEVAKARARGAVAVMSSEDVERARTEPEAVAVQQGLDPATLRTGLQLIGEEEETPPGRAASFMAVMAAADAFGAHLRFQRGDTEGVRQALGRAEASVIGVLQGIHGLRIAIGDAQEEPE